ncbi:MAG: hypothetical protein SFZ23_13275 [Planctomycetota bacterium]|nr:hypothetical protein [Planctomycetota bacterium]
MPRAHRPYVLIPAACIGVVALLPLNLATRPAPSQAAPPARPTSTSAPASTPAAGAPTPLQAFSPDRPWRDDPHSTILPVPGLPRPHPEPPGGPLRPDHVLVVYDSRIRDSVLVAEHYAGSDAVPGGLGGKVGARPGVHAFDLALFGSDPAPAGDIRYPDFIQRLRNPIRWGLASRDLTRRVRAIVLTKGLPHRILDLARPGAGDNPGQQKDLFSAGNATSASVDSELTLLWQSLSDGEQGRPGDSLADGMIASPLWTLDISTSPITSHETTAISSRKQFSHRMGPGQLWHSQAPSRWLRLTPGDVYLVCRLDAKSVENVIDMIDRARDVRLDPAAHAIVLDESASNAIPDSAPNAELDNIGLPGAHGGDDCELARDFILHDARWSTRMLRYDPAGGLPGFLVGPRLNVRPPANLVLDPVAFLFTFGSNAQGDKPRLLGGASVSGPGGRPVTPGDVSSSYAESFNYAPGAVFNSMESFNGRDFANLGGWNDQEQASDFLAAGGTFAIANVAEPFAFSVADNLQLIRHFTLGDATWAEAAYAAIPFLSWQQIVLGDPLARVTRTCDDLNADGVISDLDLKAFDAAPRDLNADRRTDARDRGFILRAVRARGYAAD